MEPRELAAIEERVAKASKGPWKALIEGRDHWGGDTFIKTGEARDSEHTSIELLGAPLVDYEFVAHAREDIPTLLAELGMASSQPSDQRLGSDHLREIETRCLQATKGPWRSVMKSTDHAGASSIIKMSGVDIELAGASDADRVFIANAREDIPFLVAELRRLRSAISNEERPEMTTTLWTLPVPSTAIDDGPHLRQRGGRELALEMSHESDPLNKDYGDESRGDTAREVRTTLTIGGVEAYKCSYMTACTDAMLPAYGRLIDCGDTDWLRAVSAENTRQMTSPEGLRHLMIYFDDGPCYEFICRSFRTE